MEVFDKLTRHEKHRAIKQVTINFMSELKVIYDFELIGFDFLGEGTKSENSKTKHNYHAIFLNYDFGKEMNKDNGRNSQSLLHKYFQHLGFDSGEIKNINNKDHEENRVMCESFLIKSKK
jgi:hypothetical protein